MTLLWDSIAPECPRRKNLGLKIGKKTLFSKRAKMLLTSTIKLDSDESAKNLGSETDGTLWLYSTDESYRCSD